MSALEESLLLFEQSACSFMEKALSAAGQSVDINPDDIGRVNAFIDDSLDSKWEEAEAAMAHSESELIDMLVSVEATLKRFSGIVASIHTNVVRSTGSN